MADDATPAHTLAAPARDAESGAPRYGYKAFLSYSHASDAPMAARLQRGVVSNFPATGLAFDPRGEMIATGTGTAGHGEVLLWEAETSGRSACPWTFPKGTSPGSPSEGRGYWARDSAPGSGRPADRVRRLNPGGCCSGTRQRAGDSAHPS
jgi:hypothetical protein